MSSQDTDELTGIVRPASPGSLGASVAVSTKPKPWQRFAAFLGPGYLVATGYMDPGNWATSLAGGSQFGMSLLWVVVLSSLMAMVLQALAARVGLATGRDLAQLCRAALPRPASIALWLVMEGAIVATDLAEVIGTAIGLQLLFGLPLLVALAITVLDVFLVLALQRSGFRKLEAFVIALMLVIAAAFGAEMLLASPNGADVLGGLVPTTALLHNPQMLYVAAGIIGATVMPHNLFLHTGILQTRAIGPTAADKREAIRFAIADSTIALCLALLVNAAILILAAAVFFASGHPEVAELPDAFRLIAPLLGAPVAATLFGVALVACGLNSTITATLAGQIVMEGFVQIRLSPPVRRLVTRLIAIGPALAVTYWAGEDSIGKLLIFSQVILSAALPFAIVPLIWFAASRDRLGEFVAPQRTIVLAGLIGMLVTGLNLKLVWDALAG